MKNFSRQREEIIRVIRSTDTHPTAAWVYSKVKEAIPTISLGTVYRNLAALSVSGEILSLSVGDGFEHFDGNLAVCEQVGGFKNDSHSALADGSFDFVSAVKNLPYVFIENIHDILTFQSVSFFARIRTGQRRRLYCPRRRRHLQGK